MSALPSERKSWSPIESIWHWCQDWTNEDPASQLKYCPEEEVARMARDLRMPAAELLALASRGPEASDLLLRRMAALDLDRNEVLQTEPATFRDLQRVCTMCVSRKRCARDFARGSTGPAWKDYCPNAGTLTALDTLPWTSRREW